MADLSVAFAGRRGTLFRLALKTSVLTVLTLGLYRFWMRTRLRRYTWSSIAPGGHPLEYAGEPMEKLLGFLVAVVMLAFYIGVVNLVLMFASYALFNGYGWAYALSFLGILPLIFFAQYRARRYVLARTRWRGIRFGVEPGAWGYARCAMLWWLATIVTLGLLWPRKDFALEKYRTDRTFFGEARMVQEGSPWMLMGSAKHLMLGGIILAAGSGGFVLSGAAGDPGMMVGFAAVAAIGLAWAGFGLVFYKVDGFRRLAAGKRLGRVTATASPRPWRILRHYVIGSVLVWLCLVAVAFAGGFALAFLVPDIVDPETAAEMPRPLLIAIGAVAYFTLFILWGVLGQVFIGFPNLRHFAETLVLHDAQDLDGVTQRGNDAFTEAEGFADALDVGASL
jgi:hypothetical protein